MVRSIYSHYFYNVSNNNYINSSPKGVNYVFLSCQSYIFFSRTINININSSAKYA